MLPKKEGISEKICARAHIFWKSIDFVFKLSLIHIFVREGTIEDLQDAEFLFLCLYPQADIDFVTKYAGQIGKQCIVTDTCGIKNAVCPALKRLSDQYGFPFVGGHPMAGKERNGFSVSEAELFDGASYILVPCGAPEDVVEKLRALVMKIGFGSSVITTPCLLYTSLLAILHFVNIQIGKFSIFSNF